MPPTYVLFGAFAWTLALSPSLVNAFADSSVGAFASSLGAFACVCFGAFAMTSAFSPSPVNAFADSFRRFRPDLHALSLGPFNAFVESYVGAFALTSALSPSLVNAFADSLIGAFACCLLRRFRLGLWALSPGSVGAFADSCGELSPHLGSFRPILIEVFDPVRYTYYSRS
jgi:hypothetical protein